jgi:hypothetical protein
MKYVSFRYSRDIAFCRCAAGMAPRALLAAWYRLISRTMWSLLRRVKCSKGWQRVNGMKCGCFGSYVRFPLPSGRPVCNLPVRGSYGAPLPFSMRSSLSVSASSMMLASVMRSQ